jgi:hypothetical protein
VPLEHKVPLDRKELKDQQAHKVPLDLEPQVNKVPQGLQDLWAPLVLVPQGLQDPQALLDHKEPQAPQV